MDALRPIENRKPAGTRTSAKSNSRSCPEVSWTRFNSPNASPRRSPYAVMPARRNSNRPAPDRRAGLLDRQRALQARIDRGYDDYVERRISEALWARKSAEWDSELATVTAELSALDRPATAFVATGERILELVKRAGILYKTQDPAEQRRLLETLLSNCTFDRGTLCPTYSKPFDLFARGNETVLLG